MLLLLPLPLSILQHTTAATAVATAGGNTTDNDSIESALTLVASGLTATGPFGIVKALRPLLPSETLRSVTVKYSPEREGSACEVCII
jgi:hypothetical protein